MVARCIIANSNGSKIEIAIRTLVIIRQTEGGSSLTLSVVLSLLQCLATDIASPLGVCESLTSPILKRRITTLNPALVPAQLALNQLRRRLPQQRP